MSKLIPTIDRSTDITVALGLIRNGTKILVAKRPEGSEQGGLLEFPGGKLERNETVYDALRREVLEETGIKVLYAVPLIEFIWYYSERSIHFYVFEVNVWNSTAIKKQWCWSDTVTLNVADFPPANRCIINALKLPAFYLITPQVKVFSDSFFTNLVHSFNRGIRLIAFRDYRMDNEVYCQTLKQIKVAAKNNAQVLAHNHISAVADCGVDGVHLSAEHLMQCKQRPVAENMWFTASCHNREELEHARHISTDFVTLSSVLKSTSHPDRSALGWLEFHNLVDGLPLPVYALGGLDCADYQRARTYGAQGIAGISGLWGTTR